MSLQRRGFTLIDLLMAMVIISTGIAATMNWMTAGTLANGRIGHVSVAIVLANSAHEYAMTLDPGKPATATPASTYLLSLDGRHFDTPLTATGAAPTTLTGQAITNMPEWSIDTVVKSIRPTSPNTLLSYADARATDTRYFVAKINYRGRFIYQGTWLISPQYAAPTD